MLTARRSPGASPYALVRARGYTLVELVFTMALGTLVLGLISTVGNRLQRQLMAEGARVAADEQVDAGAELLPMDLRAASPAAGDIVEARDTSIQFRATIGSAVVCSASGSTLLLAAFAGAGARSIPLTAQPGDTLWALDDGVPADDWRPLRLAALRRTTGSCSMLDPSSAQVIDVAHLWTAEISAPGSVAAGTVIRFTRQTRFSFYRAGDGLWYLGLRSWSPATVQFVGIQPVSGPYESPSRPAGARLQYFDAANRPLTLGSDDGNIARVELLLAGARPNGQPASTIDSQRVVVSLRNR